MIHKGTKISPSGVAHVADGPNAGTQPAPSKITEAQVIEWLSSFARQLRDESRRALGQVEIHAMAYDETCGVPRTEIKFRAYIDGVGSVTDALTLANACDHVLALATPENIAAKLRADAATLIAKADALTAHGN
jgi:hypothetical protein